jgi:hypothetical protein
LLHLLLQHCWYGRLGRFYKVEFFAGKHSRLFDDEFPVITSEVGAHTYFGQLFPNLLTSKFLDFFGLRQILKWCKTVM